jgi:predicted esterase
MTHDVKTLVTHPGQHSSQRILSDEGAALAYGEYSAGHEINAAMLRDFTQWIPQELDNASIRK